jgi:MFS family permease
MATSSHARGYPASGLRPRSVPQVPARADRCDTPRVITTEASTRSTLWRGSFAAVLAIGMAAATCVQYVFGVLATFLIGDFSISRSQLGLLTTSAFVVGAIASPVAGKLVDRIGGRRVFVGSMGVVALAVLGMALAPTYPVMVAWSGLVGAALSCCNPMTNKLIAAHLARGERGMIMGLKQAGVQIGAFVVGFALPGLATTFGWRTALAATVLLPALATVGALRLIAPDATPQGIREVRTTGDLHGVVWWMTAYAVLMGIGVSTISTYLPLYAHEQLDFSAGTAGLVVGVTGAIGILSRIVWGWAAERGGRFAFALVLMGIGSVVATVLIAVAESGRSWLLWPAVILIGGTAVTWNVVAMLAIVAEVDTKAAGLASGYVQTGFYSGFVLSPPLFGYLVDRTDDYTLGWVGIAALFAVGTGLAMAWHVSESKGGLRLSA